MSYQTLVNGTGDNLVTASLLDVAEIAWELFTGSGDLSSATKYVNHAIYDAEAAQPEGTQMEMILNGWKNPLTGTDYSGTLAQWLNSQWRSGKVKGEDGRKANPWPQYSNQIAWGGDGRIILRWVKGQLQAVYLVLYIIIALAVLSAISLAKSLITSWAVKKRIIESPKPKNPSWWDNLSMFQQALVIGGLSVTALFAIWLLSEKSIAEAGAPKQTFVFGGEQ